MKYKNLIRSELKHIARNVPYNRMIIKCANIFQTMPFHFTMIPKEVVHRTIALQGYEGMKIKVEVFEPSNIKEKLPCLIYVHGGAFSYKASAYHKKLACVYAMKAKCRVYFPEYHLTPKYPYPAAYGDVLALYKHIMKHSEELEIDDEKIGIVGDSAGAALAALICNRYEHENLKPPCIQMLVYIETAEYDCLHDEGILYGKKLWEAGAKVEINETRGTIHGYDSTITTQIAIRNIQKRITFLQKGFLVHSLTQKTP